MLLRYDFCQDLIIFALTLIELLCLTLLNPAETALMLLLQENDSILKAVGFGPYKQVSRTYATNAI